MGRAVREGREKSTEVGQLPIGTVGLELMNRKIKCAVSTFAWYCSCSVRTIKPNQACIHEDGDRGMFGMGIISSGQCFALKLKIYSGNQAIWAISISGITLDQVCSSSGSQSCRPLGEWWGRKDISQRCTCLLNIPVQRRGVPAYHVSLSCEVLCPINVQSIFFLVTFALELFKQQPLCRWFTALDDLSCSWYICHNHNMPFNYVQYATWLCQVNTSIDWSRWYKPSSGDTRKSWPFKGEYLNRPTFVLATIRRPSRRTGFKTFCWKQSQK